MIIPDDVSDLFSHNPKIVAADKTGLNDGKADLDGVLDGTELGGDQQLEI